LNRFRPEPPAHGAPGSPAAHLAERIMTAEDPDEISWLRADLTQVLDEARGHRPAPRPTNEPAAPWPTAEAARPPAFAETAVPRATVEPAGPPPSPSEHPPEPEPERSRGMLGWLRRRSA
jgi:hypothetical protein